MTPAQEIEKEAERIWRLWQPNPLMHDPPLSELEKIKLPDPPKRYPRFFVPTSVVGMEIFLGPYVSLQCFCVRYDLPDSAKGLTRHEGITVVNKGLMSVTLS